MVVRPGGFNPSAAAAAPPFGKGGRGFAAPLALSAGKPPAPSAENRRETSRPPISMFEHYLQIAPLITLFAQTQDTPSLRHIIQNSPYHNSLGLCPHIPSFCFMDKSGDSIKLASGLFGLMGNDFLSPLYRRNSRFLFYAASLIWFSLNSPSTNSVWYLAFFLTRL